MQQPCQPAEVIEHGAFSEMCLPEQKPDVMIMKSTKLLRNGTATRHGPLQEFNHRDNFQNYRKSQPFLLCLSQIK